MQSYEDFVCQINRLDAEIDHLVLEGERLRSLCDRCTTVWLDDVKQQSSRENRREEWLIELSDCKQKLEQKIRERSEVEKRVISFFQSNLNDENSSVLILKYIHGKSIGEIADLKYLSYSGSANKIYRADIRAKEAYYTSKKDDFSN